jgi:hypothetical protein
MNKFDFTGRIKGVQPRIKLIRSFDEIHHNYLGYNIFLDGSVNDEKKEFIIAIGKAAEYKFELQSGQTIKGACQKVLKPENEISDYYKVIGINILDSNVDEFSSPPFLGLPVHLEVYRERGHRRLLEKSYNLDCRYCKWACKMPTEIIIDQWNPNKIQNRYETFCYGPKSCANYNPGPNRKVPGRRGMVWIEEDWVDEEATSHRELDE